MRILPLLFLLAISLPFSACDSTPDPDKARGEVKSPFLSADSSSNTISDSIQDIDLSQLFVGVKGTFVLHDPQEQCSDAQDPWCHNT